MPQYKVPVKVTFVNNYIISTEHFQELHSTVMEFLEKYFLKGQYYPIQSPAVLSADDLKLYTVEDTNTGDIYLWVSKGVAVIPQQDGTFRYIVLTEDVQIPVPATLTGGVSYWVFLKYRETSSGTQQFDPLTGNTRYPVVASLVENTSSDTCTADATFIFVQNQSDCSGVDGIFLGKILHNSTYNITLESTDRKIAVPRLYWPGDDPNNLLEGHTPTPSVDPYTDLFSFLACKGSAPRSVTNPFGLAFDDLPGGRDYWDLASGAIIHTIPTDTSTTSLQVSYPADTYPDYVLINLLGQDDIAVVSGKKITPSDTIYGIVQIGTEYRVQFPSSYTNQATGEIWLLAITYNDTTGRFEIKWVSGTPDAPVYDEPFMYTDSPTGPSSPWLDVLSTDSSQQLLSGDPLLTLIGFINHKNWLVLGLVGRYNDGTGYRLGVWYVGQNGVEFNSTGSFGDYRKFHYLSSSNIRLDGNLETAATADDVGRILRKSVGEVVRHHMTFPTTSNKKHYASEIQRGSGYLYVYDSLSEADVDGALNAVVQKLGELESSGGVTTVAIEPTGNLSTDTASFEQALGVINSSGGYGIIVIRPNGKIFLTENTFDTQVTVPAGKKLMIVSRGVWWKASNMNSPIDLSNISASGAELVFFRDFIEDTDNQPSPGFKFGSAHTIRILGTGTYERIGPAREEVRFSDAGGMYYRLIFENVGVTLVGLDTQYIQNLIIVNSSVQFKDFTTTQSNAPQVNNLFIRNSRIEVYGAYDVSTDYAVLTVTDEVLMENAVFSPIFSPSPQSLVFAYTTSNCSTTLRTVEAGGSQIFYVVRLSTDSSGTLKPHVLDSVLRVNVLVEDAANPFRANLVNTDTVTLRIESLNNTPNWVLVGVGNRALMLEGVSAAQVTTKPATWTDLNYDSLTYA